MSFPALKLYDPTFIYPVQTLDPDADVVDITITAGPPGMVYEPLSGQVTWTPVIPADREPTLHTITLTASDPQGANSSQTFELVVYYPPLITTFPLTNAFAHSVGAVRQP